MVFNINKGLGLLELADIVLSLINPSPCYVKKADSTTIFQISQWHFNQKLCLKMQISAIQKEHLSSLGVQFS